MTETTGFARVCTHETADALTVEVSGDATDPQSHDLRLIIEQCVSSSGKPLFLDLAGLTSWEHGAQGLLLHLMRKQRLGGRTVEVIGLQGHAESQAYASGMRKFFRSHTAVFDHTAVSDAPVEVVEEAALSTVMRIKQTHHAGRPPIHATCQYGHAAGVPSSRCDQGHLVLPV